MRALAIIAIIALSACSSGDKIETYARPETRELSPAGQFAAIMQEPMLMFGLAAVIWALNGKSLLKVVMKTRKEKP